jgi:hypothetical protein
MKRNLILGSITLFLLVSGILGCLYFSQHSIGGTVAVIQENGEEIKRIDLSQVQESYTITLENENGDRNIILIEPNAISMQEANCPDGLCMQRGKVSEGGLPIVCLPHHIVITFENGTNDTNVDVQVY